MATFHELLTLSDTTATEVTPGPNHSGVDVTIQNVHETAYVYVGGEGVTAADYGFRIYPGAGVSFEVNPRDRLYVISDTADSQAALIRIFLEEV